MDAPRSEGGSRTPLQPVEVGPQPETNTCSGEKRVLGAVEAGENLIGQQLNFLGPIGRTGALWCLGRRFSPAIRWQLQSVAAVAMSFHNINEKARISCWDTDIRSRIESDPPPCIALQAIAVFAAVALLAACGCAAPAVSHLVDPCWAGCFFLQHVKAGQASFISSE